MKNDSALELMNLIARIFLCTSTLFSSHSTRSTSFASFTTRRDGGNRPRLRLEYELSFLHFAHSPRGLSDEINRVFSGYREGGKERAPFPTDSEFVGIKWFRWNIHLSHKFSREGKRASVRAVELVFLVSSGKGSMTREWVSWAYSAMTKTNICNKKTHDGGDCRIEIRSVVFIVCLFN